MIRNSLVCSGLMESSISDSFTKTNHIAWVTRACKPHYSTHQWQIFSSVEADQVLPVFLSNDK